LTLQSLNLNVQLLHHTKLPHQSSPKQRNLIQAETKAAMSCYRDFIYVPAPNEVEGTSGRKSVLILGLEKDITFLPQQVAKMESLRHLPIILYHCQFWEHWDWRNDHHDIVDLIIPLKSKTTDLVLKGIMKIGKGTDRLVILHLPNSESDVEKDSDCITLSTYQQLIDVTEALVEGRGYECSRQISYGPFTEYDYDDAEIDICEDIKGEDDM
jgi:hypothetical protein